MFTIILGQEGDDYEGSTHQTLSEAIVAANNWLDQIREKDLPTYVYILTPGGRRIDPSSRF